jgi:uncharacterized membrane protein YuzA (DUF378 family)
VAYYVAYIFVLLLYSREMNLTYTIIGVASMIGLILFLQFMYEIWDKKHQDRQRKDDLWY